MCGRAIYEKEDHYEELAVEFNIRFNPNALPPVGNVFRPRYNIRPTEYLPVIRRLDDHLEWAELRWWLIPSWSTEPTAKFPTFNARADGLADKPSFRGPFKTRRCLVVVDGFYEWPKKPNKDRRPRLIRRADRKALTLAGLWDRWTDPRTGVSIDSCTIVTTEANPLLASVPHDRMPVILDGEARHRWLSTDAQRDEMQSLLIPHLADDLELVIVSDQFVNLGVDDVRCIDPVI